MGWSIGYDRRWDRDIGYGVPSICDHPGCSEKIDRGLSYVCGGDPYGGDKGCGLYFCPVHRGFDSLCDRCERGDLPYEPKPDTLEWVSWKFNDESWDLWRKENPEKTAELERRIEQETSEVTP